MLSNKKNFGFSSIILIIVIFILACLIFYFWRYPVVAPVVENEGTVINDIEEEENLDNPVAPQLAPSYKDLIILDYPQPETIITSPLIITGQARGPWYFEASFPVVLTDWDGLIIAQGIATAQSDWMTEDYVPFKAELTFAQPDYGRSGSLILQKDNPSGLPENDDALEITVYFE